MSQTKGDAPVNVHGDVTADQDQRGSAPIKVVDRTMTGEGNEDRALLALHVAASSEFMITVQPIQTLCLSLCNACRENVPVQRLRISHGVPPSILAIVYPGLQQSETRDSSRVAPPRSVLSVHWTFTKPPMSRFGMCFGEKEKLKQDIRDATDYAVGGNVDMSEIQWPQGTREIALCAYNLCLDAVPWPSRLERLWLGEPNTAISIIFRIGDTFNKPLHGVTFPCGLREIYLGDRFDQPLEDTAWPDELERLSLPGFNQPIRDVQWPPRLKALEFVSPSRIRLWKDGGTVGDFNKAYFDCMAGLKLDEIQGQGRFNQPLGTALPPSLETLWLSRAFNQSLDGVAWPGGMLTLGLAFDLDGSRIHDSITWPKSVRDLFLVNKPAREMRYPDGIQVSSLDISDEVRSDDGYEYGSRYTHDSFGSFGGFDRDECCSDDDSDRYVDQWRVDASY